MKKIEDNQPPVTPQQSPPPRPASPPAGLTGDAALEAIRKAQQQARCRSSLVTPSAPPSTVKKLLQKLRLSEKGAGGEAGSPSPTPSGIHCFYIDTDLIGEAASKNNKQQHEVGNDEDNSSAGEARGLEDSVASETISREQMRGVEMVTSEEMAQLGSWKTKVTFTKKEVAAFVDLTTPLLVCVEDMQRMFSKCGKMNEILDTKQQRQLEEFKHLHREIRAALSNIETMKQRSRFIKEELRRRKQEAKDQAARDVVDLEAELLDKDPALYASWKDVQEAKSSTQAHCMLAELEQRLVAIEMTMDLLKFQVTAGIPNRPAAGTENHERNEDEPPYLEYELGYDDEDYDEGDDYPPEEDDYSDDDEEEDEPYYEERHEVDAQSAAELIMNAMAQLEQSSPPPPQPSAEEVD